MKTLNFVPAGADYSRVVFGATDGGDLFTLDSILSMCYVEAQLMAGKQFHSICQFISHDRCCHSWSLGNYIALLHNRTSCFGVTVSMQHSVSITNSMGEPRPLICQQSLLILQFVGFKDNDLINDNIIHITEMVCGQLILIHSYCPLSFWSSLIICMFLKALKCMPCMNFGLHMLDQKYFVLFDEMLTLNMVTMQLEFYMWVKCQGWWSFLFPDFKHFLFCPGQIYVRTILYVN